jgi:hypothetical protein
LLLFSPFSLRFFDVHFRSFPWLAPKKSHIHIEESPRDVAITINLWRRYYLRGRMTY